MEGTDITNPVRRSDSYWSQVDSADIKKAVVLWGGTAKMRKDEGIAYLVKAFKDVTVVDAALARMRPSERAALEVLKFFGVLRLNALSMAVRTADLLPANERVGNAYSRQTLATSLIERCIVMPVNYDRYVSYSSDYSSPFVFSDERILARVGKLQPVSLPIKSVAEPATANFRRPQSVTLDVLSILRAVEGLGGIGLTKAGEMRVNDVRKIARKLGWGDTVAFDGLNFPNPANAFLSALASVGLLVPQEDLLLGSRAQEDITRQAAADLAGALMRGLLTASKWEEQGGRSSYYWNEPRVLSGRLMILTALRCLPEPRAWVRFEDFDRALFARIGEHFSINLQPSEPYAYGKTPSEMQTIFAEWRKKVRAEWEKSDLPWLQAVFKTWLYAFGLVELSLNNGDVEQFRLTELGRAVLWEEPEMAENQPTAEASPAWIVQPNFDVMVYLDSASTRQIAFLEQHAERVNVAQHTVQYRLTRDSVYEGLQGGSGADELLEGLTAGSRVPLPSNIVAEICTWAGLRERITVRRTADLLEFPNAAARRQAIEQGMSGRAVGERFLLLSEPHTNAQYSNAQLDGKTEAKKASKELSAASSVIDYAAKPAVGCLLVTEEGGITLVVEQHDLLTEGYLNLWAEREGDNINWRLTHKSVSGAVQRGRTLPELRAFLRERLAGEVPGILMVALRAWTGEPLKASMAEVVVLQCPQSDVLNALAASQSLRPYLLGSLGPETLLVKRADVEKVRAILTWAGIAMSEKIIGTQG